MKIKLLEKAAWEMVGDGKRPEVFFVSFGKYGVVMVSREFWPAYEYWKQLAEQHLTVVSCLEDRKFGVIAAREPVEDGSTKLVIYDDSAMFLKMNRKWKGRVIL